MYWRLALCLLTFILNYSYPFPKHTTIITKYRALTENINFAQYQRLMKGTSTEKRDSESKEYADLKKKPLVLGYTKKNRNLQAGDVFTPTEMLPIATKLLEKVKEPGSGKGFVSSSRYPRELADKLFEAFFMTTKRIVVLKDIDISGIDTLQALALSGETAAMSQEELSPEALPTVVLRGQVVKINKPKTSKYSLVTKSVEKHNEAQRRGIALANKLKKERRLVINKRRRNEKKRKNYYEKGNKDGRQEKVNKSYKKKEQPTKRSPKDKASCRWMYICANASDLDSCRLHTNCANEKSKVDDIAVKHKKDEHTSEIKQFRKMLGISVVDEEVEKILEARNLQLNPGNREAISKVESLAEYFNNIVALNNIEVTSAKSISMYTHSKKQPGQEESFGGSLHEKKTI